MKNSLIFAIVGFVVAVCLPVSSAGAASITIVNAGFEDPVLADGEDDYSMDNQGWGFFDVSNDGYLGSWNPGLPGTTYPGYGGNAPEGQNVGWTNPGGVGVPGGFAQVLTDADATLTVDTTYTLTVEVGNTLGWPWGGYKVQLLAGGTPHTPGTGGDYTGLVTGGTLLAEDNNSLTIAEDTFETSTVTYTYDPAHASLLGEPLQIRLLSLGNVVADDDTEADFDNVRLDAEDDPTVPSVDAGADMITWSGQAVQLDPNVVNRDVTALTYLWSADPNDGVVFSDETVEDPTVTITKPALTSTAVTIVNQGFEDPVLADGGWETDPLGWTDGYYDVTAPTVWVVGDSDSGVYNPTAADGYGGVAPEGDNLMAATSGAGYDKGMNQALSANLQANTQYDLSALVGNPFLFNGSTTTADYRMELLAGGIVLESDTGPSPADDTTWTTASCTYNSGADAVADPNVGQPLEIRLLVVNFTDGKGVDFDDVKLTAEGPTPDPYTVKLTLAVNNEGRVEPPVTDTMTIDVYDDACEAARIGKGLAEDNPGDFDGNCITDANDLAELATKWLTHGGLTGPVPK